MSTYHASQPEVCLIKYADDTTLVIPVPKCSLNDMSVIASEIDNFKIWCLENCMKINSDKSKVLTVNMSTSPLLGVPDLKNVKALKILGLIFNDKLTWSSHFDFIVSKLSRRLYILRILKNTLCHDELVAIFHAVIRSVIDYASPVYLNPGITQDLRLIRLCKRAYKVIHGSNRCDICDMTEVVKRRNVLAMRLFEKIVNDKHHVLFTLLPKVSDRSGRIILPHVNTTRRCKNFFFSCSMFFNDKV